MRDVFGSHNGAAKVELPHLGVAHCATPRPDFSPRIILAGIRCNVPRTERANEREGGVWGGEKPHHPHMHAFVHFFVSSVRVVLEP